MPFTEHKSLYRLSVEFDLMNSRSMDVPVNQSRSLMFSQIGIYGVRHDIHDLFGFLRGGFAAALTVVGGQSDAEP